MNDNEKLYVMVDVVGDRTDDQYDEALLVFNFTSQTTVAFRGLSGFECTSPGTDCQIPEGVHGKVGYYTSPNSALEHKIYELSIPMKYVGRAGQAVDFASPAVNVFHRCYGKGCTTIPAGSLGYDYSTGRDNVWPQGLDAKKTETWGLLILAATPVPEFSITVIFLTSLVAASVFLLRRRKFMDEPVTGH